MKINLLLNNPDDVLSGYLNLDPFSNGQDSRLRASLTNLDSHVENGEAEEIIALDILDTFNRTEGSKMLQHWLSKIAHGGSITFSFVDLPEVTKGLQENVINFEQADELLHGKQQEPWQHRKASYSMNELANFLASRKFKIIKRRMADFRAFITAVRP